MKKLESVDYLRGLSISTIILYHLVAFFLNTMTIIKKASAFGGAGVHVFFVLSGFGLTLSYYNKTKNHKQFLIGRFQKVYISYIFVIIISAITTYMYNGGDKLNAFFSHVFLYKMFNENYVDSFGIQFWFVSTLFQFYFTYYLLMKIKDKIKNNKIFWGLSCLISFVYAITISVLHLSEYRIASSFFLQYLWELVLGIVLADRYLAGNKIDIKNKILIPIITAISFAIYCVLALKGGWFKNFNDPFALISYLGIAYMLYKIPFFKKVCVKVSNFSFEMFLLHYLIFKTVFLMDFLPNYLLCIISLILTMILAILYKKIFKMKGRVNSEKSNVNFWNKTRSNKDVSISK
ncbi:MAG: acyltransferase [Clostridia bacterium]|nr:acyltransferase [Clostridia bacterium]